MSETCEHAETAPACPKCAEREEAARNARRDTERREQRRRVAHQAAELFRVRRLVAETLGLAGRLETAVRPLFDDTTALAAKTLLCHVGMKADEAIAALADAVRPEYADLAEAVQLLHTLTRRGGTAEATCGICSDGSGQEWQSVVSANVHTLDAEEWARLHELRDVMAELVDDSPTSPEYGPGDEIPF
jgi:hypothetical protein